MSPSRATRRHVGARGTRKTATHRYEVHYNGSRPFVVTVSPSTKHLIVGDSDGRLIKSTKYRQIWIGNTKSPVGAPRSPGHSILAELPTGEFLFVCHDVKIFKLEKGDDPVKYVSYIGNNDVVYAYLVGKNNTYMLIEHVYIPNEHLDAAEEAYKQYYVDGAGAHAKKFSRRARVLARAPGAAAIT